MSVMEQFATTTQDAMNVRRVFGEPLEKDGVTIIPTARMSGGFGAGEGIGPATTEGGPAQSGSGGGSFVRAMPSGVYVVKGENVQWMPAVDVNRIVMGMQVFAVILLLVVRSIARARAKAAASA